MHLQLPFIVLVELGGPTASIFAGYFASVWTASQGKRSLESPLVIDIYGLGPGFVKLTPEIKISHYGVEVEENQRKTIYENLQAWAI